MSSVSISIIIPMYNSFKLMKQNLMVLEKNPTSKLEIIIVDDCSKDNSFLEAEKYAQESELTIKVIQNDKNSGPGFSRNKGIENATGDYITFVDSDDYLSSDFYNKVSLILSEEECDCLIFDYALIDKNGSKIASGKSIGTAKVKPGFLEKKSAFVYTYGSTLGKVYRRKIITDNEIRFADLYRNEDMPFTKNAIADSEKIYYLNEELYNYVQVENSLMHNKSLDNEKNCQIAFEILKKNLNEIEWKEELLALELREVLNNSVLIMIGNDASNQKIHQYIKNNYKKEYIQNRYFSAYPLHVKIVSCLAYLKCISVLRLIWRYKKWKKEKK